MKKWMLGTIAGAAAIVLAVATLGLGDGAAAQVTPDDEEAKASRYLELLAEELGITVEELQEAQTAARDRLIDEKVVAGELTEERAERLKQLEPGDGLAFHLGHHLLGHEFPHGLLGHLGGALGIEGDELLERLRGGESLFDIIEDEGIDLQGLKDAVIGIAGSKLDEAVAEGDLTRERADRIEERLQEFLDRLTESGGLLENLFER